MKSTHSRTIVLTGGGTAGHCMPCMYLLPELKKHFDNIYYIGSAGIEKDISIKYGLTYFEIPTCKLDRGKIWANFKIPFTLMRSIKECKKILRSTKTDVVFSKGGYVSLPVCIASRRLGIPVISHESDFSFGLANRIILKKCTKMCVNYAELADGDKVIYSGPILPKSAIKSILPELTLIDGLPTVLIFGGSQGSETINHAAYAERDSLSRLYNIVHIVGHNNIGKYTPCKNYNVLAYCDNMPGMYSVVDVVVGRAGAGTIFECLNAQLPILLIPLSNKSSRGDQIQNADYFESKGVGMVLHEKDISTLLPCIHTLIQNKATYIDNISKYELPNGNKNVLSMILKTLHPYTQK